MVKEYRNVLYISLVFFACYVLLAIIAKRPVYSFDGFWHLQMGKDLWENGLSPWVDHYSFSYQGSEISTVPVLFQVLLYQFVSFFGEIEGFYLIRLFYVTLMMATLYIYFRKIKLNWFIVLVLLPLISYVVQLRLMIRPEIFSNVLIVLCLLLYLKAQKTFATKELLYICVLLLFWVNYHSPVFGYVIVFGLFLDKAVNKIVNDDKSFSWLWWCSWGILIFMLGFIRPHGQHFIVTMFHLMSEDFGKYTQEYVQSYPFFSKNIVIHVSWVLSIYVAIWSLLKRQYGFAFIAALLVYLSLSTIRLVSITVLVNLCILALYFSQLKYSRYVLNIRKSVRYALCIVAVGISMLAFYALSGKAVEAVNQNKNVSHVLETRYPVQVADYLKYYQDGGNILNVMHIGGYLLSKLSPEYKIYFDGRTNILYPIEFLKYNLLLLKSPGKLDETIEHYDIEYAIYGNSLENFSRLQKNKRLKLAFAGEGYLLFVGSKLNVFPLSSMLMVFPSCWNDEWSRSILKEATLSEELFVNKDYTLKAVLAFMKDYLSIDDKQRFFDRLNQREIHSDAVRRLALYFSWGYENADVSSALFASIQKKTEYDVLIYIYHLAQNGDYNRAENMLYYFYRDAKFVKKKRVSFDKIAIMVRILEILEDNIELREFEPSYKGELKKKLEKANFIMKDVMSFDYICKRTSE